jgi:APA family basic amino acid/polyamine antiporter
MAQARTRRWCRARRLSHRVTDHGRRSRRNWCSGRTSCWNAPTIFGVEIGFNLPAFVIALVITAILVVGIKESARFNATIVVIKVAVVLFVIGLGFRYVNTATGARLALVRAHTAFRASARARPTSFFAYIGFDACLTTAQEAKNPQRDLPIGIIASLVICTALYIWWPPC